MKTNPVPHLTFNLWRRYFWEIAAFVIVSLGASVWALIDFQSLPSNGFTWLEVIGAFWLFARVQLAESAFGTHGGWQSRPVTDVQMGMARLVCLAGIFTVPIAARIAVVQLVLGPTPADWVYLIQNDWLGKIVVLVVLGGFLWASGRILGRVRRSALAGWVVIGLLATFVLASDPRSNHGGGGSSGGLDRHELSGRVRSLLPRSAKLIGLWEPQRQWLDDKPGARLLTRVPLEQKSLLKHNGIGAQVLWHERSGERLALSLRLVVTSRNLRSLAEEDDILPVVRFADGSYSPVADINHDWQSVSLPLMPAGEIRTECNFVSLAGLVENSLDWDSLVAGAEVLIFVKADGGKPIDVAPALQRPMSIGEKELTLKMPPLSSEPDQAEYDRVAEAVVDQANIRCYGGSNWLMKVGGSRVVSAVLGRQSYSKDAWDLVVGPFLIRHAGDEHKAAMMDLLELDPRMADVFVDKGWIADALPVCRKQLIEGRLPPSRCFLALARLRDTQLATALQREFPRVDHHVGEIGEVLQDHPGVDWEALVSEGWRRRKYAIGAQGGAGFFANWAAQLGDASALDRLLMEAARGKNWQRERLDELLGKLKPPTEGIVDWLREHRTRLRYDNGRGEWVLE